MVNLTRILALLILVSSSKLWALSVEAKLDAEEIGLGETVELTYTVDEQAFSNEPDFSPLKLDFNILSTRQSANLSVINGKKTSTTTWRLTLVPKRKGFVAIPPIAYQGVSSRALKLYVVKRKSPDDQPKDQAIFLDASVDKSEAYVQEQIIYSIRVFKNVDLYDSSFSPPEPKNTVVEQLGDQRVYRSTINGQLYEVIEFKYALFPQQSGKLQIPESEVIATVFAARGRGFGVDPFNGKQIRRVSQPIEVNIKPKPASYPADKPWLPAESITLEESWAPQVNEIKVGEPITRTIILHAKGLSQSILPPIKIKAVDGLKSYPEQAETSSNQQPNGLVSTRVENIALIATEAGPLKLPELEITWWDIKEDKVKTARLPSRELNIIAVKTTSDTPQPVETKAEKSVSHTQTLEDQVNATDNVDKTPGIWKPLFFASIFLWLCTLTLLAWFRNKPAKNGPKRSNEATVVNNESKKQALTAFKQACQNNDPKQTRRTIIDLFAVSWPQHTIRNLNDIERLAPSSALRTALQQLESQLYRPNNSEQRWRGEGLIGLVTETIKTQPQDNKPSARTDILQPLYPAAKS